jgi:hypothetical protein
MSRLTAAVGRTLFAPWVLPVARCVLLVSPLALISRESNTLDRLMLMAVWTVLNARWVFSKADSNWRNSDFFADTLVLLLATCKVLNLSTQTAAGWLVPILTVHGMATLVYLLYPEGWRDTDSLQSVEKAVLSSGHPPARPLWATVTFSLLLAGQGAALAFLDSQSQMTSTRSILLLVESAVAVQLVSRPAKLRWIQSWMLLQLCTLPFYYSRDNLLFAVALYVLLAVMMLSVTVDALTGKSRGLPVLSQLWDLVEYGLTLVGQLLLSPVLYLSLAVLCAAVIISSSPDAWYTSTATFPSALQKLSKKILGILDEFIKPVWIVTSDPVVQQILIPAASEIGLARLSIYRAVYQLLPIFVYGRDGVVQTYTPLLNLSSLLLLIAGPVLVALSVAASLFPNGGMLIQSPIFWLIATAASAFFLIVTQVVTGITGQIVRILFKESEYSRNYTQSGELAFLCSCGLLLACFMMVLVTTSPLYDESLKDRKPATGGKYSLVGAIGSSVQGWSSWVLATITAPYVLMSGLSVFIFIGMIGAGQNPISEFKMVKVKNVGPEFDWFTLTALDQTSPLINSLTKLLVNAIGPQARLAPIIALLLVMAEGAIQCIPCLCIPLGPLKDVADDIADVFSRRRLLSVLNFDPAHPCDARPSTSCNGISICISDVLKDILTVAQLAFNLMDEGLRYATEELVSLLSGLIPGFSFLNDAFSHITDILSLVDFDFTEYANLDLPPIGSLSVPSVELPATYRPKLPVLSSALISACVIVSVLAVLSLFGFLRPVLRLAWRSAVLSAVISFWAWILLVVVFLYELRDEVRIFTGYEARVVFDSIVASVYLFALALLAMATITFLGEVFLPKPPPDIQHNCTNCGHTCTLSEHAIDIYSPHTSGRPRAALHGETRRRIGARDRASQRRRHARSVSPKTGASAQGDGADDQRLRGVSRGTSVLVAKS